MFRSEIVTVLGLNADVAIAEIDNAYTCGASDENLERLQVLAAHIGNLWPASLQDALPGWLAQPIPQKNEIAWRQLRAYWFSLHKGKFDVTQEEPLMRQFCDEAKGFLDLKPEEVGSTFLKDLYIEAYSSKNADKASANFSRMSAFYYRAKKDDRLPQFEDYMHGLMRWFFYNQTVEISPEVVAIHMVHSEGLDRLPAQTGIQLLNATQLGWFSWWHLLQLSYRTVDEIARSEINCLPLARDVLDAVNEYRRDHR